MHKAVEEYRRIWDVHPDEVRFVPPPGEAVEAATRFAFFPVAGTELELIEPVSPAFRASLLDRGFGINHMAFNVRDLPATLEILREKSVRPGHVTGDGMIDLGDRLMAYLNPEDTAGLLVELVQEK